TMPAGCPGVAGITVPSTRWGGGAGIGVGLVAGGAGVRGGTDAMGGGVELLERGGLGGGVEGRRIASSGVMGAGATKLARIAS
ncbi:MAG: hypothetical protein RL724_766, partial [Pseudomonadota bacterium]